MRRPSTPSAAKRILSLFKDELQQELSYTIKRPYNLGYPHFKAAVFSSFTVLLVVLIFFNFANVAYNLQPRTRLDPNATADARFWYTSDVFTFGDDKLRSKCQEVHLALGDEFTTGNFGLRYKIDHIQFDDNGAEKQRTTVAYLNNTLTNCTISSILVNLDKLDNSHPNDSSWLSWYGSKAQASGACNITNEEGRFSIGFTTDYGGDKTIFDITAVDDPKGRSSLWWGSRLMILYFASVMQVMAKMLPEKGAASQYKHAKFRYSPNITHSLDFQDPLFFDNEYNFLRDDGRYRYEIVDGNHMRGDEIYNNASYMFSRPLTEGFFFAKVYYSLVLADLGNNRTSNLLLEENLLRSILAPEDDFNRPTRGPLDMEGGGDANFCKLRDPKNGSAWELMGQAYDSFRNGTGKFGADGTSELGTNGTTIYTQYVCQVPEKKSTATAILFTVVATMSLMQAAWAIFKWIVELKLSRQDNAMDCQGCSERNIEKLEGLADLSDTDERAMMLMKERARTA